MNKALKEAFRRLADRLSPENLNRDGEATASEADRDYRQCLKEWKALGTRSNAPSMIGFGRSHSERWCCDVYPKVYDRE